MYRLFELIFFAMHLMIYNGADHLTRFKIPIFLKIHSAFAQWQTVRYYLSAHVSSGLQMVTVTQCDIDTHWSQRILVNYWLYDAEKSALIHFDSNLRVTANTEDWSLDLEQCGNANQNFIYDASSNELFWKNPITKKLHVIYIRQRAFHPRAGVSYRCLVAVNDMHSIQSFDEIKGIQQRKTMWDKITAFCLSKYNGTCDLSSETIQNWFGIIESFAHNNVTFGLFKTTARGRFLLSDGFVITTADPQEFDRSAYKYYGLWKINPAKGYLVHYLSGKCVTVVHPDLVRGICQFKLIGLLITSNGTEHFRVLQLSDSTSLGKHQFVKINGDNQMSI